MSSCLAGNPDRIPSLGEPKAVVYEQLLMADMSHTPTLQSSSRLRLDCGEDVAKRQLLAPEGFEAKTEPPLEFAGKRFNLKGVRCPSGRIDGTIHIKDPVLRRKLELLTGVEGERVDEDLKERPNSRRWGSRERSAPAAALACSVPETGRQATTEFQSPGKNAEDKRKDAKRRKGHGGLDQPLFR